MDEFGNELAEKFDFDFEVPCDSKIDSSKIAAFLKDGDTLIFYGGEPLINFPKMKEIMDAIEKSRKKIRFCMQTNGKLLNEVPLIYLKKISKILVSIDGDMRRTDYNRGLGTYDTILRNIIEIRERGFEGEIVARMTLSFSDVYDQVRHLIGLIERHIFDSVHWQIDAGFYKSDFDRKQFKIFVKQYNKSINKLLDLWIDYMKENKKVLKLYPFLGIFDSLYYNKPVKLQCGSGHSNYTISTDGKIVACTITNGIRDFYCGDLYKPNEELKEMYVKEPCTSCDYLEICGGRCLYSNYAKLWPEEGQELICETIKHLIDEMYERLSEIKELINKKIVSEDDFEFERYFGPEIIP